MYSKDSNELLKHVKETLQEYLYMEQAKELRKKKGLLKHWFIDCFLLLSVMTLWPVLWPVIIAVIFSIIWDDEF